MSRALIRCIKRMVDIVSEQIDEVAHQDKGNRRLKAAQTHIRAVRDELTEYLIESEEI